METPSNLLTDTIGTPAPVDAVPGMDTSLNARTARLRAYVNALPVPEFATPWRREGTIAHLPAAKLTELGIATNSEPWKLYREEYNTRLGILECRIDVDLATGAVKGRKGRGKAATEGEAPATEGETHKARRTPAEIARDKCAQLATDAAEISTWVAERAAHTPSVDADKAATLAARLREIAADLLAPMAEGCSFSAEWGIAKAVPRGPAYTPVVGDRVELAHDARAPLTAIGATMDQLAAPGIVRAVIPTAKMAMVDFSGPVLPVPIAAIRKVD